MLFKSLLPFLALATLASAQDPTSDPNAPATTDGGGDNGGDQSASASPSDGGEDPSATDDSQDPSATDGSQDEPSASDSGASPSPSADQGGDQGDDQGGGDQGAGGATPDSGGQAGIAPSEPSDQTVVKAGQLVNIQWSDVTGTWNNMTISLMSGSNEDMTWVTSVGEGIDATTDTSYTWNVPQVYPYSKVWFFQFTNNGQDTPAAWTTRFTIAGPDGATIAPPLTETISGSAIGYAQNGRLEATSGASQATNTGKATATGQAGNGVTIYTAGINTGTDLPQGIKTTGIKAATDHAVDPSSGKRLVPGLAMAGACLLGAAFVMA